MQVSFNLLLSSFLLASCGGEKAPPESAPNAPSSEAAKDQGPPPTIVPEVPQNMDPVLAMYSIVDALFERPEHGATSVVVQNCLIGIGREYSSRAPSDAEKLVAKLLQDLAGGAKFEDILRDNSNASPPGIYTVVTSGQSDMKTQTFLRGDMPKAFGDAAWRLKVGEVGITAYDPNSQVAHGTGTSPLGMHIIKRLK